MIHDLAFQISKRLLTWMNDNGKGLATREVTGSNRIRSYMQTMDGGFMRETAIFPTARTVIGRAYRSAFNDIQPQALAARPYGMSGAAMCGGGGLGAAVLFGVAS
ncbi:hypothetical protein M9978_12405 [Sphingomonas sp. MG17]|uniref:Uncharacterized protein n=1 Tax=Sphingomonas tagetis TaxID=2949092 RepID=A0A9X2HI21_9SPHN|nr:hypothetical protein [Sphingomonas tagetis]MCP3731228.1 hypothetical protein [Sphingomonas tagetis]